nr:betaV1 protein [Ludwigia yellow vein virus-associated DNA beta]
MTPLNTWQASSKSISITGASAIMIISIISIMSSCWKSPMVDSLYMILSKLHIPSSKLLKSNGGMIPWWPYGMRNLFLDSAADLVENKSTCTRIESSALNLTLMMNCMPFLLLYVIVIVVVVLYSSIASI